MSWEKEIEELKKRENLAEGMGGKEKLERQKKNKRLSKFYIAKNDSPNFFSLSI